MLKWKEENGKEVSQAVTSTHEKNIVPETTTEPTMDHDSDKMTSDSSSICSPPTQEDRPPSRDVWVRKGDTASSDQESGETPDEGMV